MTNAWRSVLMVMFLVLACTCIPASAQGLQSSEMETMEEFFGVNAVVEDTPADMKPFAGWVRDYTQWGWFEPANNQLVFTNVMGMYDFDRYYGQYDEHGIDVLMCIQRCPKWISSNPDHASFSGFAPSGEASGLSPEDYREAAEFYYQVAARYGSVTHPSENLLTTDKKTGLGIVDAIEVMNEADGDEGWGNYITIEQYAALLNAVYDGDQGRLGPGYGVKAADPNMPVSITGVAYGLESIKAITAAAGRAPYDIINIHHYCFVFDTRWNKRISVAPEWGGLVELLRDTVAWRDENAPGKPIWLTEFGWDSDPEACSEAVTEQEAANYLIRSMILAKEAGADKAFWFYLKDIDENGKGIFSTCGLFRNKNTLNPEPPPKLVPKLTYWYYSTLMNYVGPTVFDGRVDMGNNTVYHYRFSHKDGGQTVSVLWYCPEYNPRSRVKPPEQVECVLETGQPSNRVKIVRPVSGSIEGEIVEADWTGETTVTLQLSATPIFVVVDDK